MTLLPALLAVLVATPNVDSVWRQLKTDYSALSSLRGDFDQTICSDEQGTCQSFSGSFSIRMPDCYRIEVVSPDSQLIVCDENAVWFYFPEDNYAVKQPPGQSVPLMAFLEPMLDPSGTVSYADSTPGKLRIGVTTADSLMTMTDMELELGPENRRIVGFSFSDAWGNSYHFRLDSQEWNPQLPEGTFSFTPPEGVVVD